jgi:adenylosuccinate synthase
MKTALDWLIEQMPYEFRANHTQELFKQAKELEKEQIIEAHFEGWSDAYDYLRDDNSAPRQAEDYYNEYYNQKQHIIDIMKADEDDGLYNPNK